MKFVLCWVCGRTRGLIICLLFLCWALVACSENVDSSLKPEKPRITDEPRSYLPFANSIDDKPPTSIGLINEIDANDSVKIAEVNSAGNMNFLYETAFNYQNGKIPAVRDRDYNASIIYAGQYNPALKHVSNYHADSFLYAFVGRLYRQPIWQTRSTEAALVSSENQLYDGQLCAISSKGETRGKFLFIAHDYENINNSKILYKLAKFTTNAENKTIKSCAAKDVTWKLLSLGMQASDAPLVIQPKLTGGILQPVNDITTGALTGWIAIDWLGAIHHFNADFSSSTQIPIPSTNGDQDATNDWIVWLGMGVSGTSVWFATHGEHILKYDIVARRLEALPGTSTAAINVLPDQNHRLQVYGAYKNDQYPLFGFDDNYLYFVVRNTTSVAVQNNVNQYNFLLRRLSLFDLSVPPQTLAEFQAHDIGKLLLTTNKVVVSASYESQTNEGTQFLILDKNIPYSQIMNVLPTAGHQCVFNLFSHNNAVFGNSIALSSCQQPTTQNTHIHFFRFDESGQSSFRDAIHSRILAAVNKAEYNPFVKNQKLDRLVVKRNVSANDSAWIDEISMMDPDTGLDLHTIGKINGKAAAISARVTLMPGFNTGLVEYMSAEQSRKLFTFSLLKENSMSPFLPQFQAQASNRWITPFTLPP